METDDNEALNEIPSNLRNYLIYNCRIYISPNRFTEFVLTNGPILYEIKQRHILASCDLSNTILKANSSLQYGKIINGPKNSNNISVNVYFSYKKKIKEIFYFLRANEHLIILGKAGQRFVIHREFENIREHRVVDENSTGESSIEIVYTNGHMEIFQLASLSYIKNINLRYTIEERRKFVGLTQTLTDRVAEANSHLATLNYSMQKELVEYGTQCQFVCENSNEEVLSRYGDIWVKNCNECIVIGIPVYNCSVRKYLIENVRVSLFCSEQLQLSYTHKMYEFQMKSNSIMPLTLEEYCDRRDDLDNLTFEQEWVSNKKQVLFPEMAAMIVIKTNLVSFEKSPNITYDTFILYDIVLEDGSLKQLQLQAGSILLDTDVLYDAQYAINFDCNYIFRDLLAVIATATIRSIDIRFEDDSCYNQLLNIFVEKLNFEKIETNLNVMENTKYLFSTQLCLDATINHNHTDAEHRMFYCNQNGYWNETLIRIRPNNITEILAQYQCQLKIYNRQMSKIENFITMISNEFGRKIHILPARYTTQTVSELELKHEFKEEANALQELANSIERQDNVPECYQKFICAQYKTDLACSDIQ